MSVVTKVGLVEIHEVGVPDVDQNILVTPNNEGLPGCHWETPPIDCITWIGGPTRDRDRFPSCQKLHLRLFPLHPHC